MRKEQGRGMSKRSRRRRRRRRRRSEEEKVEEGASRGKKHGGRIKKEEEFKNGKVEKEIKTTNLIVSEVEVPMKVETCKMLSILLSSIEIILSFFCNPEIKAGLFS